MSCCCLLSGCQVTAIRLQVLGMLLEVIEYVGEKELGIGLTLIIWSEKSKGCVEKFDSKR